MSLEWSSLDECFSSPLQNINSVTKKNNNWSEYDKGVEVKSNMSSPYQIDTTTPNVALAEDALRQVINDETHHLYGEQPNNFIAKLETPSVSFNPTCQSNPSPQYQQHQHPQLQQPQQSQPEINSDLIRQELRDITNKHRQLPPQLPPQVPPQVPPQLPPQLSSQLQSILSKYNNINYRSTNEEENNWITVLIIFITVFLLLSCN